VDEGLVFADLAGADALAVSVSEEQAEDDELEYGRAITTASRGRGGTRLHHNNVKETSKRKRGQRS
jgi:hypothetical protein